MTVFVYEGKKYQFDEMACYNGSGIIRLPDNRLLRVGERAWGGDFSNEDDWTEIPLDDIDATPAVLVF
jgi:hypothetical protein